MQETLTHESKTHRSRCGTLTPAADSYLHAITTRMQLFRTEPKSDSNNTLEHHLYASGINQVARQHSENSAMRDT